MEHTVSKPDPFVGINISTMFSPQRTARGLREMGFEHAVERPEFPDCRYQEEYMAILVCRPGFARKIRF